MGEVVEISLKAETYEAFYLLLTELKKYTTNNVESKIEIMDNWEYENKFSSVAAPGLRMRSWRRRNV